MRVKGEKLDARLHCAIGIDWVEDFYRLCADTNRRMGDVVMVAALHRRYNRAMYADHTVDTRGHKIGHISVRVRLSAARGLAIKQFAWEDRQPVQRWLGVAVDLFLRRSDRSRVIEMMARAEDIMYSMTEIADARYAKLVRARKRAARKSRLSPPVGTAD